MMEIMIIKIIIYNNDIYTVIYICIYRQLIMVIYEQYHKIIIKHLKQIFYLYRSYTCFKHCPQIYRSRLHKLFTCSMRRKKNSIEIKKKQKDGKNVGGLFRLFDIAEKMKKKKTRLNYLFLKRRQRKNTFDTHAFPKNPIQISYDHKSIGII